MRYFCVIFWAKKGGGSFGGGGAYEKRILPFAQQDLIIRRISRGQFGWFKLAVLNVCKLAFRIYIVNVAPQTLIIA